MTGDPQTSPEAAAQIGREFAPDPREVDEISLQPLVRTLWGYRRFIGAAVSGILILFILAAAVAYLVQPAERHARLEFRLIFEAADRNEYPNGLRFSRSEIISGPILSEVFDANDLERYWPFEEFKNAVFILESSRDLDLLSLEYEGKLAEARLTAAERTGLEEEFRRKRDGLQVPQYTLSFISPSAGSKIPNTLMNKVLNDILARWAEYAARRKGVLHYQIRVYTPNVLPKAFQETDDYLVRADVLRGKINGILENLDELVALPGASITRVGDERISLPEIRANLEDLLRFRLEPLMALIRQSGLSRDMTALTRYLENRLFQIRLEQREAQGMVTTLEESLRAYMMDRGAAPGPAPADTGGASGPTPAVPGTPAPVPQFGESFLDRLVAISSQNTDVAYRQRLTDRIIAAGERSVSLERETAYYRSMMDSVRRVPPARDADPRAASLMQARLAEIDTAVVHALEQANTVYEQLSTQNLNPRTNLYTITGPFSTTTQHVVTLWRVAAYGALTLMVSLILVPLGCSIHHYFLSEILGRRPARAAAHRA